MSGPVPIDKILEDTDARLVEILLKAGDEWGPLGVAITAAQLTDQRVLFLRLTKRQVENGDAPMNGSTEPAAAFRQMMALIRQVYVAAIEAEFTEGEALQIAIAAFTHLLDRAKKQRTDTSSGGGVHPAEQALKAMFPDAYPDGDDESPGEKRDTP